MKAQSYFLILIFVFLSKLSRSQSYSFSEFPQHLQFYARDQEDSCEIKISGSISTAGLDSVLLVVNKGKSVYKTQVKKLNYISGVAAFSFQPKIHSELSEYAIKIYTLDGGNKDSIAYEDSLACGDVFLINGQSNSHPTDNQATYKNEYCRSFGVQTDNYNYNAYNAADTLWGLANANQGYYSGPLMTGVWGLKLMQLIKEKYKVPICILNGGSGGSSIEYNLRDGADSVNLNTTYGRLLYRAQMAKLADKAKAIMWHQGESNTNSSYATYELYFDSLYRSWHIDYPNIKKVYVFQIHHGCGGTNQHEIREIQRNISKKYSDVSNLSTMGIKEHDGCHYGYNGYNQMAQYIYYLVAKDFYQSKDTLNITSPNIVKAYYNSVAKNKITLVFDAKASLKWGSDTLGESLKNYFYLDNSYGLVTSGNINKNTLTLNLSSKSNATTITYTPNLNYNNSNVIYQGPYLTNTRGVGAFSFYQVPIEPNPPPVALMNISKQSICVGDTVSFNDVSLNSPSMRVWSFNWNSNQVTSNYQSNTFILDSVGSFSVKLTVGNSTGSDSVIQTIIVKSRPTAVITSIKDSFCDGTSVQLVGSGGVTYKWSPTYSLNDSTLYNPVVNLTQSDIYSLTVTDSFGCRNTTQKRLMVLPNPTANAGADIAICNGSSARLLGAGGISYRWSPGAFMNDSLIANPKVNPSKTMQYILSVKNAFGCESFDTTEVAVLQLPYVAAGTDLIVCYGQQNAVQLTPVPTGGIWNRSEVDSNQLYTPLSVGNYKLIYTFIDTNGCMNSDTIKSNVIASPDVHIEKSNYLCSGEVLHLKATLQHAGGILWQSKNGGQFEFVDQPITSYTPDSVELKNQIFTIYATTTNNGVCVPDVDSAIIKVKPLPAKPKIKQSGLYLLSSPATQYQWYLNSNLLNGEVNQVFTPSISGLYSVMVFDSIGCMQKSDEIGFFFSGFKKLFMQDSYSIYPNPNNGHFQVQGKYGNEDIKTIVIYDMMGKEVYKTRTNLSSFEMDVNQLINGIYSLHILTETLIYVDRFTIKK